MHPIVLAAILYSPRATEKLLPYKIGICYLNSRIWFMKSHYWLQLLLNSECFSNEKNQNFF